MHQDPHPHDVDNELPQMDEQGSPQANHWMCQHQHRHDANTNDEHAAANPLANANTIWYNDEQPWTDKHQQEDNKWVNQRMHQQQYQHNTNNMSNNTHANAPSSSTMTNSYEQTNAGEQEHKRAD